MSVQSKPVAASRSEMVQVVQPEDANPMGVAFGGKVVQWMDLAGGVAATRHARRPVVTASIDHLSFLAPIHVGDFVLIRAAVNYAGKTSMEVGVTIEVEDPLTGQRQRATRGYLTFVALDGRGQPTPVPAVVAETDKEKQRFDEARRRRELKLQWRQEELI
jgi:acyl-CoA hydrolase